MRRLVASGLAAVVSSAGLFAFGAVSAHADTTTARVSPVRGTWYSSAPFCGLPLGCGSVSVDTAYPDDTLHVGATGGQEAARAYLGLSSTALSSGVSAVAGQLVVPVDDAAGTNAPEIAALQLCLVPGGLSDPAPETAPAVDCTTSSPLSYLPGTPSVLAADLGVFLARTGGRVNGLALALVPVAPSTTNTLTTTWHVAFSSPQRKGGAPVVAELDLAPAATAVVPTVAGPEAPAVDVPVTPTTELPPLQPPAALPPVTEPPLAVAPPQVQAAVVPASFVIRGHRHGLLWAMPLGLFLLGWAFVSTCRRDVMSYAGPVPRG